MHQAWILVLWRPNFLALLPDQRWRNHANAASCKGVDAQSVWQHTYLSDPLLAHLTCVKYYKKKLQKILHSSILNPWMKMLWWHGWPLHHWFNGSEILTSVEYWERMNLCMIFETTSWLSSAQVPETKSLVPWSRKGKVTIRRQNDIRNEVRVTIQSLNWHSKVGFITGQLPDDQSTI